MASRTTAPLFTRAFILLTVADLSYFTAMGMALFALPLYVTGPIGGDEFGAGLSVGAFAISALILRPIAGRLSDQFGRRPLLLGGALLAALSLALIAVTADLGAVVALRLLAGVAEAAFFVAGFAALADLAPPERMGEALSYNSLGLYLGLALGPPFAELLVGIGGFDAAWFGAAGLAALAAVVAAFIGETRTVRPTAGTPLRIIHRPAIPVALAFLASLVAVGGFLAFASLYATGVGLEDASLPLLTYGISVVVCRVAFARVPDRIPPLALGAASLGAIALGLATTVVWQNLIGLLIGIVLMAVGISFSTPAFFSAIFATAQPSERGIASGTASAAIDLGLGLGPIALGVVASAYGIPWAFAVGAAVAAAGAVWTLAYRRRMLRVSA